MKLIAAVDKNWAIGRDGGLLCRLSGDLKYFKQATTGKTVVMGRKTLESLPQGKPLPDRKNVVLTGNADFMKEGCVVVRSVDELLELQADQDEFMVIGGGSVYRQLLPYCDILYITKIDAEFEADTYLPNLDSSGEFEQVYESEAHMENGVSYRFTRYERIKND